MLPNNQLYRTGNSRLRRLLPAGELGRYRASPMPITPFHFGPGAVLHAVAPKQVSFLAFCAANVLIDVEPLYYMLTRQYPLRRFFHTYVGATIVAAAIVGTFIACRWFGARFWLPNLDAREQVLV